MTSPTPPDQGLSNINVVRDFTYTIASSSLSYVRNYNFNTSTLTPVQVVLQNKSNDIPITVDISASHPWLQIREPGTNKNLVTPAGNVVLTPSSSKLINLNVDLPPEIEALSDTSLQISMSFYLRSGSYPILQTEGGSGGSGTSVTTFSFDKNSISVQPNNINTIDVSLFQNGNNVYFQLDTVIEDETVAEIVAPEIAPTVQLVHTITVRGLREGNTNLRFVVQPGQQETSLTPAVSTEVAILDMIPILVYPLAPSGGNNGGTGGGSNDTQITNAS